MAPELEALKKELEIVRSRSQLIDVSGEEEAPDPVEGGGVVAFTEDQAEAESPAEEKTRLRSS